MARSRSWLAALSVAILGGGAAQGAVIMYAMEGTVGTITNDPLGMLHFVHVGDRVKYTFAFDTDAPDQNPSPNSGAYVGLWSTLRVGDQGLSAGVPGMEVAATTTSWLNVDSSFTFEGHGVYLYFRLVDYDGIAIGDPSVPTVAYDLSLFENPEFEVSFYGPPTPPSYYPTEAHFYGPIDRFYIVPEPGAGLLATLALVLRVCARGNQRRKAAGLLQAAS